MFPVSRYTDFGSPLYFSFRIKNFSDFTDTINKQSLYHRYHRVWLIFCLHFKLLFINKLVCYINQHWHKVLFRQNLNMSWWQWVVLFCFVLFLNVYFSVAGLCQVQSIWKKWKVHFPAQVVHPSLSCKSNLFCWLSCYKDLLFQ